ncbi:hypothetical protein MPDQ_006099 [Monascus purpureus]|uniref:Yeast cell wall synthesis Kre9/Knh1-like N-terminal domain-containing protein n=1 Tax=Monascus purpureus TaxID=5098 RepID=A0A507R2H8_MONPU|nr:hypothetical protein MPDQ_006099 [Monascus purpureus]BDD62800.1 hypothetical protein MAP00_007760 [Monascus purpureus]
MRFSIATSVLTFAAYSAAISITSPTKNEEVDFSEGVTVKWSSVSTDPSTFDLYLVNMHVYPNVNTKIASGVKTSDGSYTIKGVSGITSGDDYQVNFLSDDPQNSGILAQSEQFSAEASSSSTTAASSSSASTSTASSETTSTGSSTTLTVASTTSGSSTATGSSTSSGSSTFATSASSTGSSTSSATGTSSSGATHASSSAEPSSTSNAAAGLIAPATAGGFLMGLFALFL